MRKRTIGASIHFGVEEGRKEEAPKSKTKEKVTTNSFIPLPIVFYMLKVISLNA